MKQLSKLYRALVWEGFILHAAATASSDEGGGGPRGDLRPPGVDQSADGDDSSSRRLLVTLGNAGRGTVSTQQETGTGPTVVTVPMCSSSDVCTGVQQMTSPSSAQSLRPLLLSLTSRVGRSLAELMSLLVRMSTGTLHRPQRRGGVGVNVVAYLPPSPEAIAICQEATNLLVDSLGWKVPVPQSMKTTSLSPAVLPSRLWLFTG